MANSTVHRALRVLQRRGAAEVGRRAVRHFQRQWENRRFVRATAPSPEELARERKTVFSRPLCFSIIVPLYNTSREMLEEMTASVQAQSYADWELCLADGSDDSHGYVGEFCRQLAASEPRVRYQKLERNGGISENTNACLHMARGDYFALLDHDDLLMPHALYEVRDAIEKTGADFLYSDEMIFRSPNRRRIIGIRMKPAFSPDTLRANNYICHLTCFSRELLERAGEFRREYDGSQDHDMILRLTGRAKGIAHISKVLYLWRSSPASTASDINSKTYAIQAGRGAVKAFLREQQGIDAEVESTEVFPTMYRVRYPIDGNPSVRVILDARRGKPEEPQLRRLQEKAGWTRCAWTVLVPAEDMPRGKTPPAGAGAGGQNEEPAIAAANTARMEPEPSLAAAVHWLCAGKTESRRALWARAAAESREEYLLFLSDLPAEASDGWIRELLSLAQQPHVGAVGPKILFTRGEVRQAGIVLGMGPQGLAGRLSFRGDGDAEDAFFGQLAVVEDVAAVADGLMISREKYEAAGGFDQEYRDALFEVDLCVRLLEKGYYNVYTPHARLWMGKARDVRFDVGREYASYPADAAIFRERNAAALRGGDPCYNPNLSLKYENWRIRADG